MREPIGVAAGVNADPGQEAVLDRIYTKIGRRILPFLMLMFVLAWLDRVNVGFAQLQMSQDLGFSGAVYGFGAGIFFLGYLLFEVPSNLMLARVGARKTIARIALLWGLFSIAQMFVKTPMQFYVVRFMLGAAEAGMYPGVLLYLTYWFPARRRGRMTGAFQISVPTAGIIGGPISGWIMASMIDVGHLHNWQWLFLLEGIPSVLMGIATFFIVDDRPSEASWLSAEEKRLVQAELDADHRSAGPRTHGFGDALRTPRVWLLSAVCFLFISANPTLGFWGPTIIRGFGVTSNLTIGLLSAVPFIAGIFAIIWVARHSDRTLERRFHCAAACIATAAGLILIGVFESMPVLAFMALIVAQASVLSIFAPFWQIPNMMLTGAAAAGGIALINSIGNLSGWLGPFLVGWLRDVTGRTSTGLYVVAGFEIIGALILILFMPSSKTRQDGAKG